MVIISPQSETPFNCPIYTYNRYGYCLRLADILCDSILCPWAAQAICGFIPGYYLKVIVKRTQITLIKIGFQYIKCLEFHKRHHNKIIIKFKMNKITFDKARHRFSNRNRFVIFNNVSTFW